MNVKPSPPSVVPWARKTQRVFNEVFGPMASGPEMKAEPAWFAVFGVRRKTLPDSAALPLKVRPAAPVKVE